MPVLVVVILEIRPGQLAALRHYEQQAARIMESHGGRIERTVSVPVSDANDAPREIHVIRFPDDAAFAAYRADPALAEHAALREQAIASTTIYTGIDGPDYHALA